MLKAQAQLLSSQKDLIACFNSVAASTDVFNKKKKKKPLTKVE